MNNVNFIIIITVSFCFLAGCTSTNQKLAATNEQDNYSCGPRSLFTYAKVAGKGPYQIKDIYTLLGKETGGPVSMLELKRTALKLGFEAKGYLLETKNIERVESYF